MLDNADMDVEFQDYPFSVRLIFLVVGTDKKVIFECSEIASFSLVKEPAEDAYYSVFEVHVTEPRVHWLTRSTDRHSTTQDQSEYLWEIVVEPAVQLHVMARSFKWWLEVMTVEEIKKRGLYTSSS